MTGYDLGNGLDSVIRRASIGDPPGIYRPQTR